MNDLVSHVYFMIKGEPKGKSITHVFDGSEIIIIIMKKTAALTRFWALFVKKTNRQTKQKQKKKKQKKKNRRKQTNRKRLKTRP